MLPIKGLWGNLWFSWDPFQGTHTPKYYVLVPDFNLSQELIFPHSPCIWIACIFIVSSNISLGSQSYGGKDVSEYKWGTKGTDL